MNLADEHPGSVASTNAKAALAMKLTVWGSAVTGLAFLFCVVTPGKDSLADNILWVFWLFVASFLGINMQQRNNDRKTDWGLKEREMGYATPDGRLPGAKPEVQREVIRTETTETTKRETVGPPAQMSPRPPVPVSGEPNLFTDDERGEDA